jgi:hypothetical protein
MQHPRVKIMKHNDGSQNKNSIASPSLQSLTLFALVGLFLSIYEYHASNKYVFERSGRERLEGA